MFSIFPSNFCDCSLSSLPETLSNSPCHSPNKLPFLHHFNSKSSRKRYGFSLFLYKLHVLSLVYLNLWVVDLIWDICCFGDGLDECLLCLDFWVLLIRLLGFYFCFHGWYWLSVYWSVWCLNLIPIMLWFFVVYCNALCVCFWLIQNGCV